MKFNSILVIAAAASSAVAIPLPNFGNIPNSLSNFIRRQLALPQVTVRYDKNLVNVILVPINGTANAGAPGTPNTPPAVPNTPGAPPATLQSGNTYTPDPNDKVGDFDNCAPGGAENAIQADGGQNIFTGIGNGILYYVFSPKGGPPAVGDTLLKITAWNPLQGTVSPGNFAIAGDGLSVSITKLNSMNQLRSAVVFDATQLVNLGQQCNGQKNTNFFPVFRPAPAAALAGSPAGAPPGAAPAAALVGSPAAALPGPAPAAAPAAGAVAAAPVTAGATYTMGPKDLVGDFDNCIPGGAENAIQAQGMNILEGITSGTLRYVVAPNGAPFTNAPVLTIKSWNPLQNTVLPGNFALAADALSVSITLLNSNNQLRSSVTFDPLQLAALGEQCSGAPNGHILPVLTPGNGGANNGGNNNNAVVPPQTPPQSPPVQNPPAQNPPPVQNPPAQNPPPAAQNPPAAAAATGPTLVFAADATQNGGQGINSIQCQGGTLSFTLNLLLSVLFPGVPNTSFQPMAETVGMTFAHVSFFVNRVATNVTVINTFNVASSSAAGNVWTFMIADDGPHPGGQFTLGSCTIGIIPSITTIITVDPIFGAVGLPHGADGKPPVPALNGPPKVINALPPQFVAPAPAA